MDKRKTFYLFFKSLELKIFEQIFLHSILRFGDRSQYESIKIGGTSVATGNIEKVTAIIKEKVDDGGLSSFQHWAEQQMRCWNGKMASTGNEEYKQRLQEIEQRHISTVKDLIPVQHQSALLSLVKKMCNEIEEFATVFFY
jgi:aspartokinase/homoserine dehydrogenase 1